MKVFIKQNFLEASAFLRESSAPSFKVSHRKRYLALGNSWKDAVTQSQILDLGPMSPPTGLDSKARELVEVRYLLCG